jgi:toxin ParE1/3/4
MRSETKQRSVPAFEFQGPKCRSYISGRRGVECCEKIGVGGARSKTIEELPLGVEVMRCQEHYIFFMPDDRSIILAILHGSMDMLHHVKDRL